jgi:hypothetical protein
MTTTKMEVWTLSNKKSQLYITRDNKDVYGSMDSITWRKLIICTLT